VGDSQLELVFASFLDSCPDIVSFAKNYCVTHFKLDNINADGNISNYYPDFIVKVRPDYIVIVETKGLEDLNVPLKMRRLRQYCIDLNKIQSEIQFDYVYVNQDTFEVYLPNLSNFQQATETFTQYREEE